MILRDKSLDFKADLENIVDAEIIEAINQEYVLMFTALLDDNIAPYLNHNHIVEVEDDYFNIVAYRSYRNGAAKLIDVECEHVSYDLNLYELEYFAEDGTPEYILGRILQGTGFTVGTVDVGGTWAFSIQERLSKRCILLEFAAYIGAEIVFNQFSISLLERRGCDTGIDFKIGKNIAGIEKSVDTRENVDGQPKIAYTLDVVELRSLLDVEKFELGDTVGVLDDELGINTSVRVVRYRYNPIRRINSSLEIENGYSALSDTIFRIQRDTLFKGATYHGVRISPELGFESIRSDKKARAHFNSDTFAMQTSEDEGQTWINKIYFDPIEGTYVFDGLLSADTIQASDIISNVVITQHLYAAKGNISELTVDQFDTSTKVQKYMAKDTSPIHYIKGFEQHIQLIEAVYAGGSEQLKNRNGALLYWIDDSRAGVTTTANDNPVMVYTYNEAIKMEILFESDGQYMVPKMVWGVGIGEGNKGKGYIWKDATGLVVQYITATGVVEEIRLDDTGIIVKGSLGIADVGATPPANPVVGQLWFDTTPPSEEEED